MSSPETTPERDLSRAHWQRSEASALYSHLFDHVLTSLDSSISDPIITDHMEEIGQDKTGFHALNHLVHLPYLMYLEANLPSFTTTEEFEKTIGQRIHTFTYEGSVASTMEEGLKTAMAFPANFLKLIDTEYSNVYGRPLVKSLRKTYQIYVTPEFSTLIHQAAFAPNGFWPGRLSELPIDLNGHTKKRHFEAMPNFIPDKTSRLGLRLDTTKLHAQLGANNKRGNSTLIPGEADLSDIATSGCPVRIDRAQYHKTATDETRLQDISSLTGLSSNQLTASKPKSGIQAGLDFMADIIRRAVILEKRHRIGNSAIKATETSLDQVVF